MRTLQRPESGQDAEWRQDVDVVALPSVATKRRDAIDYVRLRRHRRTAEAINNRRCQLRRHHSVAMCGSTRNRFFLFQCHWTLIFTHADDGRGGKVFAAVCLSVCVPDISKTDANRMNKLDIQMSYNESCKPTYFHVKRSKVKDRHKKTVQV